MKQNILSLLYKHTSTSTKGRGGGLTGGAAGDARGGLGLLYERLPSSISITNGGFSEAEKLNKRFTNAGFVACFRKFATYFSAPFLVFLLQII